MPKTTQQKFDFEPNLFDAAAQRQGSRFIHFATMRTAEIMAGHRLKLAGESCQGMRKYTGKPADIAGAAADLHLIGKKTQIIDERNILA